MKEYRVTWTIDVAAGSAKEAAQKAREMQADPETTATVYFVTERRPFARTAVIDLAEDTACPDDPDGLHHVGCGCEE